MLRPATLQLRPATSMSENPHILWQLSATQYPCLRARNTHVATRKLSPGYPETTTQQLYITLTDPQPVVTDPQPDAQFFRTWSES